MGTSASAFLVEYKKQNPAKLSLGSQRYDLEQRKWVPHPGKKHVETVWGMDRDERVRVWQALGRYDALAVLELGGYFGGVSCPMDWEELAMLMPDLRASSSCPCLAGLRVLCLKYIPKMDDAWLRALAQAECGPSLTSLHLAGSQEGVTDEGLRALSQAGCGSRLTSLSLEDLKEGVTDEGLRALAQAGCGRRLTKLTLISLRLGVTDEGLRALAQTGCGRRLTKLTLINAGRISIVNRRDFWYKIRIMFWGLRGNFAAALGLPREFYDQKPQAVYREFCWRNGIDPETSLPLEAPSGSSRLVHAPFLKTCIVGCERIGKTCLARALHGDAFDPDSRITQGIVLRELLLPGMRLGEEELDVTLRIMDAGGQHYFDFLKPMLMQDRALVLLCVRVGDEAQWAEQLREYLDVLSTLMQGGVVLPVITQADLLENAEQEQEVLALWRGLVEPLLERYAYVLELETAPTLVSSKTGRGVDAVVERLREGACKLPEAQELHRAAYVDFARVLLQVREEHKVISLLQARQLAELCGFGEEEEETVTALHVMEQWMVTCKLTGRDTTPAMAVLDVEWMSLLLLHLLHPDPEIIRDEGVLSERLLFDRWMQPPEELLHDEDVCRAFLQCLSELHVSLEEHSERFGEAVVVVPHAMGGEVPAPMRDAVQACRQFPHGGWRARPLHEELSGEGRRVVDSVVFCQLLLFLRTECLACVVKPCRGVGLVRVDGAQQWVMLCSTRASISYSLVECGEDPQTFPYARDIPVSLAPLSPAHHETLAFLRRDVVRFLRRGHQQLLEQLSPLVVCSECLGRKDGCLIPCSFSEAELEAQAQQGAIPKCRRCQQSQRAGRGAVPQREREDGDAVLVPPLCLASFHPFPVARELVDRRGGRVRRRERVEIAEDNAMFAALAEILVSLNELKEGGESSHSRSTVSQILRELREHRDETRCAEQRAEEHRRRSAEVSMASTSDRL